jgi:hypothetical protein
MISVFEPIQLIINMMNQPGKRSFSRSQAGLGNAFTRQAQLGNHFRSQVQLGNEGKKAES